MGLRLAEGVDLARVAVHAGRPVDHLLDRAALARLADDGWLTLERGRLRATAAGRQRLDAILARLLGGIAQDDAGVGARLRLTGP
jgi:oxygen-independent coproporphyrinogen-3 oxidase